MEFLRDSVPKIDGRAFWVNGTNKRISLEKKIYENYDEN